MLPKNTPRYNNWFQIQYSPISVPLRECCSEIFYQRAVFTKITSTTNQFLMKLGTNSFVRVKWLMFFLISVLPPSMNFVIASNGHPNFHYHLSSDSTFHSLIMTHDILSTKIWSERSHDKSKDVTHNGIMILFMPKYISRTGFLLFKACIRRNDSWIYSYF